FLSSAFLSSAFASTFLSSSAFLSSAFASTFFSSALSLLSGLSPFASANATTLLSTMRDRSGFDMVIVVPDVRRRGQVWMAIEIAPATRRVIVSRSGRVGVGMDTAAAERVGRYQLLEPIGVGPNGTVARAKVFGVAGFERQFALKRFHPELTTSAAMAQALSAAARAYGGLEHPRIARMSEFGVAQGTTFTAVEFVAGLDALRLISEVKMAGNTLPAGGALALVSQAA